MLTLPRRRHRGEDGQTLIMALAFIAFFGVVVVAVLRVAEIPGLQHGRTEVTALKDAAAEGGAAYAAADAGRTDLALTCAANNTGQVTMQSGDTASYSVKSCNPGQTAGLSGPGPGANCILCILNLQPSPTSPTRNVLDLHCAQCTTDVTTSGGDIYVNGTMSKGSLIAGPSGAHIRFVSGATFPATGLSPTPTFYSPAITDPLGSVGAPLVTYQPLLCPNANWDQYNGCTQSFNGGTNAVNPGLWASLTVSGNGQVTMLPGVYVFTGGLSATGDNATISAPVGVTIFLTCPLYGKSGGQLCKTPGPGGSISLAGKGATTITAPTTGTYAGISILADPNLTGTVLSSTGKGGLTSNTADVRSGDVNMQGNGGMTITGRLIANSLTMSVSGNTNSGLNLSGGTGVSTSACGVFDAGVQGSTAGTASPTGRAVLQSQCGTASSLSGVVAFNYKQ